jgi:hypothetical protein
LLRGSLVTLSSLLNHSIIPQHRLDSLPLLVRTRMRPRLGVNPVRRSAFGEFMIGHDMGNPACLRDKAAVLFHLRLNLSVSRHVHPLL